MKNLTIIAAIIFGGSLFTKGQTTIDYVTGTANVNIPIYSLKGYTMDIPVSLTYNTGGIKVNDIATWVGLGWNLHAGGAITREVHGLPDEIRSLSGLDLDETEGGYLQSNDVLVSQNFEGEYNSSIPSYTGQGPAQTILPPGSVVDDAIKSKILNGRMDLEPDVFQINAPGLVLKFVFGVDDKKVPSAANPNYYSIQYEDGLSKDQDPIICIPKQDVSISYTRTQNEITSFTVTNLDGTRYLFEKVQRVNMTSQSDGASATPGLTYASAWMLTSITNGNNQIEAEFTYVDNPESSDLRYYEESRVSHCEGVIQYTGESFEEAPNPFNGIGPCEFPEPFMRSISNIRLAYVRLSKITTINGTLEFITDEDQREDLPGDYALEKVVYTNDLDYIVSYCKFNHAYFNATDEGSGYMEFYQPEDSKRLKLTSISYYDGNDQSMEQNTAFVYSMYGLPSRNSYSQDHWGYCNNQPNESLSCQYDFGAEYNGVGPNREPGITGCHLEKIIYPDNGFQRFEFEPHTYSQIENVPTSPPMVILNSNVVTSIFFAQGECIDDEPLLISNNSNFSISHDQDVYLQYTFEITAINQITPQECEQIGLNSSNTFFNKKLIIQGVSNPSIQYIRDIASEESPWENTESVHLEEGTYIMYWVFDRNGYINYNVLCEAQLIHFDLQEATSDVNRSAGGLRLKKIITSDGDNDTSNDMVSRFEYQSYEDAAKSSGILLTKPIYSTTMFDHIDRYNQLGYFTGSNSYNATADANYFYNCNYHLRTSSPVEPLQIENGGFILYENIKVFSENEGQSRGYTSYYYEVIDIPENNGLLSGITQSRSWQNTALREVRTYDSEDNLISSIKYEYSTEEPVYIWGYQVNTTGQSGWTEHSAYGVDHQAIKQAKAHLWVELGKTAINAALSYNSTFGLIVSGVTAAIQIYQLVMLERIQNNNPQAQYFYDGGEIIKHGLGVGFAYRSESFKLSQTINRRYAPENALTFLETNQTIENYHYEAIPKTHYTESNAPQPYNYSETRVKFCSEYEVNYNMMGSANPMIQALSIMKQRGIKTMPVETITYGKNEAGLKYVTGGELQTYKLHNGLIVPHELYTLDITNYTYAENAFLPSFVINPYSFFMEKMYRLVSTYTNWDENGNPIEVLPRHGTVYSVIRDYADKRIVANVMNAETSECQYNSFETDNTFDMTYNILNVISETETLKETNFPVAKTGNRILKLTEEENLVLNIPTGKFVFSLWNRIGDIVATCSLNGELSPIITDYDQRGWYYLEYEIDNISTTNQTLTIETSDALAWVDEVRVYPVDAMMMSTTFNADATVHDRCDQNNRCEYFGYSIDKRPLWVMDDNYSFRASLEKDKPSWVSRLMLNENAPISVVLDAPFNSPDVITTTYFQDGLGRITQSHALKQSPGGKDIISATFFDAYGESARRYLPYTRNYVAQNFVTNFIDDQLEFYVSQPEISHTNFPFAEFRKDDYPGAPIIESGNVGEHWQIDGDHTVYQEFSFNAASEVLFFVIPNNVSFQSQNVTINNGYEVSAMNGANAISYWPENSLVKVMSKDENGSKSWSFIDSFGRLIMKRSIIHADLSQQGVVTSDYSNGTSGILIPSEEYFVDTYYVYDAFGNLRFELSPELIRRLLLTGNVRCGVLPGSPNGGLFNQLGYYWEYDYRNNLKAKKTPGTAFSYYIYDDIGQLVMTQDAKQKLEHKWSFYRYDVFGRMVYSGVQTNNNTQEVIQQLYYDDPETISSNDDGYNYNCYEFPTGDVGNVFKYSRINGPSICNDYTNSDILHVAYYDTHAFVPSGCDYAGERPLTSRSRGMSIGSYTKVIEMTDFWLASAIYYDRFGRPIQVVKTNILQGYDRYDYTYDWRGLLLKIQQEHLVSQEAGPLLIVKEFDYDRMGRLLATYQKTGDDPTVMIAGFEYNELGQLLRKHLHIPEGNNSGMQTIDYQYNERGWLRKINNTNLVDDGVNLEDYDVFGLELHYVPEDWTAVPNKYAGSPLLPVAQYNGNLAAMVWNAKNPEEDGTKRPEKTYVYRYDELYRLTCGAYAEESHEIATYGLFVKGVNNFLEKASYNLSGDIVRMRRYRESGDPVPVPELMDDLVYEYATGGHRITRVTDNSSMSANPYFAQFIDNSSAMMEYFYDELGNCVQDWNKLLSYEFNEIGLMNKATHIDYQNQPCEFVYDASGNRLSQKVMGTTTYFINGAEYIDDGNGAGIVLQSIMTSEGIVRRKAENESNPTTFVYDYFLRDHLGNIRVIITEGNATDEYEVATMELNQAAAEESQFEYLPFSRSAVGFDYPATSATGTNVSELNSANLQGPANLASVLTGDQISVNVQSWYPSYSNTNGPTSVSAIVSAMLSGLLTQGAGIVNEATLLNYAGVGGTGTTPLTNFLDPLVDQADMTHPQGFLIYIYFDEFLNINSQYSGMIQVGEPGSLEMLQSQAISIPSNGYFYTYLTNYSDNLVSFDNLTIRRKNGVVRAVKEYYPYGLEYGRYNGNFAYNAEAIYDRGYGGSSWQDKEWFTPSGSSPGLDLNYFEARYYDPILGRWHSPDPLEQCHSPYLALLDDPANHIDPDGRSAWASLCGTAAHGAQSFTTVMNVSSAFSQTFGAFGGVMQFVSSSASIAGGLRMVKNLLDFVNGGAEFSEVAGNWGRANSENKLSNAEGKANDWHEENGMTVSDDGDNIYSLIRYVESRFDTKIELNGNLWNDGNYEGPGMHSFELYNTYKGQGGMDCSMNAGEVRIPNELITDGINLPTSELSSLENFLDNHFYSEFNLESSVGVQATIAPSPGTGVIVAPYTNIAPSARVNLFSYTLYAVEINNQAGTTYFSPSDGLIKQGVGASIGLVGLDYQREILSNKLTDEKLKFSTLQGALCFEYNFTSKQIFVGPNPSISWAFIGGFSSEIKLGLIWSLP